MRSHRQSGKINLLAVGAAAMGVLIIASLFFAKEDPANVGSRFMDALARHDADQLTALSYIGKTDPASIDAERKKLREQWDFCVNTAGQHYFFTWKVTGATMSSDSNASVVVMIEKVSNSSYEEKFELPMEKEGDKWKVDVAGISREMFPGLPDG